MKFNEVIDGVVKIVGIFTPIVLAYLAYKQHKYHKEVNGKMGDLLDTTKKLGNAEGRADQTKFTQSRTGQT